MAPPRSWQGPSRAPSGGEATRTRRAEPSGCQRGRRVPAVPPHPAWLPKMPPRRHTLRGVGDSAMLPRGLIVDLQEGARDTRAWAGGGYQARRVQQARESLPESMHVEVGRMDARARPQLWVGERSQGVGCRPFLDRRAHALGRIRWVSNQGLCRGVMGVSLGCPGHRR
jgi:hypothetical protein